MKEIAVVVSKKSSISLANTIKQDLIEVFDDYININIYVLDTMNKADEIKADAILTMISSLVPDVKNYVKDIKKIIAVTRTISKEAMDKIYDIPKNSNVLVVNDTLETTYETVTLLYQLGVNSLNFIPYIKNNTNLKEFETAITPGQKHRVPGEIKTVVDLGNRKLDTQTFFNLFNLLNINNDKINKNLINYMQNISEKNTGINKKYMTSYLLGETLKTCCEGVDRGGFADRYGG